MPRLRPIIVADTNLVYLEEPKGGWEAVFHKDPWFQVGWLRKVKHKYQGICNATSAHAEVYFTDIYDTKEQVERALQKGAYI